MYLEPITPPKLPPAPTMPETTPSAGRETEGMMPKWRPSAICTKHEERILHLSAKVTALIVTMQIIVLVNDNHTALEGEVLPEPYGMFLESLSFLALDMVEFVPLSCLFGRVSHLQGLMAWTVGPLSLIALVSILIVLSKHEQRKVVS